MGVVCNIKWRIENQTCSMRMRRLIFALLEHSVFLFVVCLELMSQIYLYVSFIRIQEGNRRKYMLARNSLHIHAGESNKLQFTTDSTTKWKWKSKSL